MASRRRDTVEGDDWRWVREQLGERWREREARFAEPLENGLKDGHFESPYGPRLARLDAGEPVVVPVWQLPADVRRLFRTTANDDCVVESDGRVALVMRRHVAGVVRYFREDGSEALP